MHNPHPIIHLEAMFHIVWSNLRTVRRPCSALCRVQNIIIWRPLHSVEHGLHKVRRSLRRMRNIWQPPHSTEDGLHTAQRSLRTVGNRAKLPFSASIPVTSCILISLAPSFKEVRSMAINVPSALMWYHTICMYLHDIVCCIMLLTMYYCSIIIYLAMYFSLYCD